MKKTITAILTILICQISFSQITQEDISRLKGMPETYQYQLNILEQKQVDGIFKTTKHNRFELKIVDNKIKNQKIYDTINNTISNNRKFVYLYNKDKLLERISETDFKDNIITETIFLYNRNNKIIFRTTTDEEFIETKVIRYFYDKCKVSYFSDLLNDVNVENTEDTFHCKTITTDKKTSNYKTSLVEVFKVGTGKVKEIDLKGDKDSEINRYYRYEYDENGQVIQINLHRKDKIKVYKTYKYNKKGDIIFMKSGYVEFYYSYKYDKHNNWIEKIETSKVKNKRRVFKRTFMY